MAHVEGAGTVVTLLEEYPLNLINRAADFQICLWRLDSRGDVSLKLVGERRQNLRQADGDRKLA
jgi:hypothetical protein